MGFAALLCLAAAVSSLDGGVRASWRAAKVTPAPAASNAEFIRRVTLDLVGRVPTRAEVAAYRGDHAALVDRLLADPGYAEHWADVTGDLLVGRGKNRDLGRAFLVDAFTKNLRWDELARRILTASGPLADHGEGAFIFGHLAMGGSAEALAGATARIFLGLQIQCAQCHDHPYDRRWKQEDFYGLAAFFARTRAKPLALFDAFDGQMKMKKHGSEEEVEVRPRFLGRDPTHGYLESRRTVLAREIVASDLFAKAAVNRIWAALFGRGIIDPWDDLGGERDADHPPLLRLLAADFVAHRYDLRWLLKKIVLSEAYDRASTGGSDGAEKVFARASVRPMGAEALFRSLVTATGVDAPDGLKPFIFVFGDDEMREVDGGSGTVQQALLLFNGPLVKRGVKQGTVLRAILDETSDPARRLDAMFAAAFARAPTAAERGRLLPLLAKPAAYEDVFFAMLTSTEFTTCH